MARQKTQEPTVPLPSDNKERSVRKALGVIAAIFALAAVAIVIYQHIGGRPTRSIHVARVSPPPSSSVPTPVPTELPCDVKLGLYDNHVVVVSGADISEEICTPRVAGVGWTIVPKLEGQCVQILYGRKSDEICRGVVTYNLPKVPQFRLKSLTGERVEVTIVTHRDGENWEYVLPRTTPV
jgi:hypothetical protein